MAYNVKFAKGTLAGYNAIETKDIGTVYFITDEPSIYLGGTKYTSVKELAAAITRIGATESNIASILNALSGIDLSAKGSVQTAINAVENSLNTKIGTISNLKTTSKSDIVGALNEVIDNVNSVNTSSKITLSTETTPNTGFATTYTLRQGSNLIGQINLPKDLVVQGGKVVVASADNPITVGDTIYKTGDFIELTIANQTDKLYINVNKLVDIYTGKANASQVQVSVVDGTISATIVAGSVTATELANNSVTTGKIADSNVTTSKIADGNVTKLKLDSTVQNSLAKADSAVQTVVKGSTNGTISVDGNEVSVYGLGSAAYTDAKAYDSVGSADTVKSELIGNKTDAQTALTINGLNNAIKGLQSDIGEGGSVSQQITNAINQLDVTDAEVAKQYISQVSQADGKVVVKRENLLDTCDAKGDADTALNNAKSYTDTALTWGSF